MSVFWIRPFTSIASPRQKVRAVPLLSGFFLHILAVIPVSTCLREIVLLTRFRPSLLLHFSQLFRLKDPRRLNLDQVQIVHIVIPGAPDCQVLIDAALRPYDLTCRHLTLASVIYEDSASATEAQMRLTRLLEACTVPTSRADLLRILTRLALVRCAATEKCSKLYVGDNCSRIAVDIMAATCTGRGEALPWMLSPRQVYLAEDVQVVRPLRDLVKLEIDYHIDLVRAQYPPPPYSIIDKVDGKEKPESIYDLTDSTILHVLGPLESFRIYWRTRCRKFGHSQHRGPYGR